ncbi:DUF6447 family protein [Rubrivirga sp.]|uniref:DUF6447 family protein n=1 Tax=Rubrivirga sp. TaxID=1885344 RepID=UPI003C756D1D
MATITIDGKQYDEESLSKEARDNVANLRWCDGRLGDLKREAAIAQTARNAYAQALRAALPKDS